MKSLYIKLPDPMFHHLSQRAQTSGASHNDIVHAALAAYLLGTTPAPPLSCADRAQRWTGMMEGAADLSTDAQHLSNFGGRTPLPPGFNVVG